MADNFLQFSDALDAVTSEEAAWLGRQLEPIAVIDGREYHEDDDAVANRERDLSYRGFRFLRDYEDLDEDADVRGFEAFFQDRDSASEVCLFAETNGDPGRAAHLVQKFLKRFRPDQCWSLTYASTCSKMRVGEFSGGAVFVTAEGIRWQNSLAFVEQERAEFSAQKAASEPQKEDNERRRWVLYDLDMDVLLGTKAYHDHAEAVQDADQANNILVLPLTIKGSAG